MILGKTDHFTRKTPSGCQVVLGKPNRFDTNFSLVTEVWLDLTSRITVFPSLIKHLHLLRHKINSNFSLLVLSLDLMSEHLPM